MQEVEKGIEGNRSGLFFSWWKNFIMAKTVNGHRLIGCQNVLAFVHFAGKIGCFFLSGIKK